MKLPAEMPNCITRMARCGFQTVAYLVLVLLATAAATAQQDVDPEHFDKPSSTPHVKPAVTHGKNQKSARKRRPKKTVTASAKSHSQQAGQTGRGGSR